MPLRVKDLGEQGLLRLVQSFCPVDIIGDDAALLTPHPGRSLVVTSDVLVDGVHFSDRTTTATDVGWRAAAANLSDLAAMGATPLGITVGLALPGEVPVAWVEGVYQGMTHCLNRYGAAIVGGDLCRSAVITLAITALGEVAPNSAIRRGNAQPGDAILVTGAHGASRAGLELLLYREAGQSLSLEARNDLIQAHQRPHPRLDVLPLFKILSSSRIAGMDSSDGLADAVLQICRASSVGARIERDRIPMPEAFQRWLSPDQALNWALYGGEDFELVLCLPPTEARELVQQLGKPAAIVGTITTDQEVWLVDSQDKNLDQQLMLDRGFQHF
ncbi:MAG: thiamine-phosphate kinase [Scytolyngbya sp. HA4215-MV1]|jgi:thiamine-monophosphate kinase|nr:thiamine-phosphate kinase [Scytolyngbya sp. HA4215-MV1]